MLDALNDPAIEQVVVMSSAQVGKTEILLNLIGYYIDYDPSPILLLQPTLEMAQTFSKDRLAPMLRDTPALRGQVADVKSRSAGNTMLHKTFPGGHITMAGANSPASLASRPIRILLADEVDRYPASAGAEGDPVNLAKKRTTTFWNRKIVLVSTPTIKGLSRIEAAYEDSTQERFCLPCPSCGDYQQIRRQHIEHIREDEKLIAVYASCEHCGVIHTESEWKIQPGKWIAGAEHHKCRGFHLNEYMSPWRKWLEIEQDFLIAKRSPQTLKTFVNTSLGETWEEDIGEQLDHANLYGRREHYPAQVPIDNCVITAAVDTQDDRFEIDIVAWVAGEESYRISYERLYGDLSRSEIWSLLAKRLRRSFTTPSGLILDVKLVLIDSGGHYTDEVYQFCKAQGVRRFIPVKGHSLAGKPIAQFPRKRTENGVYLTMIGTDTAKEVVNDRLKIMEPGEGYVHWPVSDEFDEEYFKQLTNERRVVKFERGRRVMKWDAGGRRQEPFDTAVYNLAAIRLLQQNFGVNLSDCKNSDEENDQAEQAVIAQVSAVKKPRRPKSMMNMEGF
jgi:phage terminase large subunit GpA-like protein